MNEANITPADSKINKITETVIGCAYKVSNTLGCGFLEKVYENALAYELQQAGAKVQQQLEIPVYYGNILVGNYTADLLVDGLVLVELKTVKALDDIHLAQCMNYLRATQMQLCLLINFYRPRVEIRRVINQHSK
jgi:GxxExxY protein